MSKIGSRVEVWFSNIVAAFLRYVAERVLILSVPMMVRQQAVLESFEHAKEKMQDAYSFFDRYEGLTLSIQEARHRFPNRIQVLEFGVYKAGMINLQARRFSDLKFVGFDSFEGLNETWKGMAPKGAFDRAGKIPKARKNVTLIKGWFSESVPQWQKVNQGAPPLLVHIDCDTYGGTTDVLHLCAGYVREGVILHFDDYFGFPNWKNAGFKALNETAERLQWQLTFLSYGTKEVAVLATGGPGANLLTQDSP
jgi:hypothetical protein